MSKKLLLAFFIILGIIIRGNEISSIRLEIKNPGESRDFRLMLNHQMGSIN